MNSVLSTEEKKSSCRRRQCYLHSALVLTCSLFLFFFSAPHLYNFSMFVKEKLDEGLQAVRLNLMRDARITGVPALLSAIQHKQYFAKALDRCVGGVGAKCVSLLSTGNVISTTGLDLMQVRFCTLLGCAYLTLSFKYSSRALSLSLIAFV